jgi:phosphonate transport system substrate-binding protein
MRAALRPRPTRRHITQALAWLAAAACQPTHLMAAPQRRVWRLAVVPQLTPVEMYNAWTPVVEALAQADVPCELVVHPSIARFEQEFRDGGADIVFLNPYHMVMARQAHGYVPLLRDAKPLEGVLVVRQDSPYTTLAQLRDQRIAFPAPNALAASLYIRAALDREHRVRHETWYAMNHRNAIRQVLTGDAAAAGVVRTTLALEPESVRQSLRVLYTTPALAPHPIAVHPRVPGAVRQRLREALLAMAADPARKPLLQAIQMPDPVPADYERDYAGLNRLGLNRYVVSD